MIKKTYIVESKSLHPYHNQAVEASLLDRVERGTAILYIWANDKTVFIGKNQNAYSECDVQRLKEDGGYLARRLSGGGAVYHDKGNLNFTFLSHKSDYSLRENFSIVMEAVNSFGIDAELSGRNDCTIDGKKFSGNAFYSTADKCFHHGTILIATPSEEIGKYLNASKAKLASKGVKSVVSRVTNLSEYSDRVSYSTFSEELIRRFKSRYPDSNPEKLSIDQINKDTLQCWQDFFSDDNRIMGDDVSYNFRVEQRFPWGVADVRLQIEDGIIQKAKIYTDALECDISSKEAALIGKSAHRPVCCEVLDILQAVSQTVR